MLLMQETYAVNVVVDGTVEVVVTVVVTVGMGYLEVQKDWTAG